jgi:hypothetical protein
MQIGAREPAASVAAIAAATSVRDAVVGLFSTILPPLEPTESIADWFTPSTAAEYLDRSADLATTIDEGLDYADALAAIDATIARLEGIRDELLRAVGEVLLPLERSYRLVDLFFANAEQSGKAGGHAVDLHLFDGNPARIADPTTSVTLAAVEGFARRRNRRFDYELRVAQLVLPGYVPDPVRFAAERVAHANGMLLVGDLRDHKGYRQLVAQFEATNGEYRNLLRADDEAATSVVLGTHVKLRDAYWYESGPDGPVDLYAPASMLFAGALVRTDRQSGAGVARGPVGMRFGYLAGVAKARFESPMDENADLMMNRQLITVARHNDGQLRFAGSRALAHDPYGVYRFFGAYRVLRYLEMCIRDRLTEVADERLRRDTVDERVLQPLTALLGEEVKRGTILSYQLEHDYRVEDYARGKLALGLQVTPTVSAETFTVTLDTPTFRPWARDGQ